MTKEKGLKMRRDAITMKLPRPVLDMRGNWCETVVLRKPDIGVSIQPLGGGPLGVSALKNDPAARATIKAGYRRLQLRIVE
jgi:hypothetical protein